MSDTLLDLANRHFNPRQGTFNHKHTTELVATRLRLFLEGAGLTIPERFVQVEGKKTTFTVEMPRIRHVWWPKANTAEAIGAELHEILAAAKEALT